MWLRRGLHFRIGLQSASKRFPFTSGNSDVVQLGSDFHLQIAGHILSLKALKLARLANVKSLLVSYAQLRSESVLLPASRPIRSPRVPQTALKGCSGTFLLRFLQPEETEGSVDLTPPSPPPPTKQSLGGLGMAFHKTAPPREKAGLATRISEHALVGIPARCLLSGDCVWEHVLWLQARARMAAQL